MLNEKHSKTCSLGNRLLSDEGLVFTFNAWDYVKFSEEDVKFALLLVIIKYYVLSKNLVYDYI
jgi:hypothetical protein